MEANANIVPNTITFDISNYDPGFNNYWWTISLTDNLPDITGSNLQVLGFTQTTNQWDSNPGFVGSGGTVGVNAEVLPQYARPEVAINGNHFTAFSIDGSASGITIEGLSLYNMWDGVWIGPGTGTNREIRYMLVGTMPDGTDPGAERTFGHGIVVGQFGTATITSNYIGWNGEDGILGDFDSTVNVTYNEVFANGEDLDAGQNAYDGIDLNGLEGTIQYNLIRENRNASGFPRHDSGGGIELGPQTGGTGNNLIDNNTIVSNLGAGISIRNGASLNFIRHNIITGNEVGISVNTDGGGQTDQNTFTENEISSNFGLGIDLHASLAPPEFDDVTLNDDGDVDTGANELMNFPVLYNAFLSGSNLIITGESRPDARIEFFRTDSDPTGYGEGEIFLGSDFDEGAGDSNSNAGSVDATADAFTFVIPAGTTLVGDSITATTTDAGGTSEFSENITVEAWFDPDYAYARQITVSAGAADVDAGYSASLTFDHASLVLAGKSLANGDDVRIAYWDGIGWTELDRIVDPLSDWDDASTKIWFRSVNLIFANEWDSNYYLLYGNASPPAPAESWAGVFMTGDDFEDGSLTAGLTTSVAGSAAITEQFGVAEINGGSTDSDAGIILNASALPTDKAFAAQHQAALMSGGPSGSSAAKMIAIIQDASPPIVAVDTVADPRRRIFAYQQVDGLAYIVYVATSSQLKYWDGATWSNAAVSWGTLSLGTSAIYDFVSDGTDWWIVVSDASGTPLMTTGPEAWSKVRDTSGDLWLYWGEVYTNKYWATTQSDWFYLRDYVNPEPASALGGEMAL